jgi:hypothetical protein
MNDQSPIPKHQRSTNLKREMGRFSSASRDVHGNEVPKLKPAFSRQQVLCAGFG